MLENFRRASISGRSSRSFSYDEDHEQEKDVRLYSVPGGSALSNTDKLAIPSIRSEDSSVFSGLSANSDSPRRRKHDRINGQLPHKSVPSHQHEALSPCSFDEMNEMDMVLEDRNPSTSFGSRSLRSSSSFHDDEAMEEDDFRRYSRSSMKSASMEEEEKGYLRNLPVLVDDDTAFGHESHADERDGMSSHRRSPLVEVFEDSNDDCLDYEDRYDDLSQQEDEGHLKLISEVPLATSRKNDSIESEDSEVADATHRNIEKLLKQHEEMMQQSLDVIQEEDIPSSGGSASMAGGMTENFPISDDYIEQSLHHVQSMDGDHARLTRAEAKELLHVLYKARQEVQVLRDNNEQFMAEIEQSEEEQESERKLLEQRTKQKTNELKAMHSHEIDMLVIEKDAAIVKASQQAAVYAQQGRKEIRKLKAELARVQEECDTKLQNSIQKAATEVSAVVSERKDAEYDEKITHLRKEYDAKIRNLKSEARAKIKASVQQAVETTTQRLRADLEKEMAQTVPLLRERLEREKSVALQSAMRQREEVDQELATVRSENAILRKEMDVISEILRVSKEKMMKHHSRTIENMWVEEKTAVGDSSRRTGSKYMVPKVLGKELSETSKLVLQVLEMHAFLLDSTETSVRMENAKVEARFQSELNQAKVEQEQASQRLQRSLESSHREKQRMLESSHVIQMNEMAARQQTDAKRIERLEQSLQQSQFEKREAEEQREFYHKCKITMEERHKNIVHNLETKIEQLSAEREGMRKELKTALSRETPDGSQKHNVVQADIHSKQSNAGGSSQVWHTGTIKSNDDEKVPDTGGDKKRVDRVHRISNLHPRRRSFTLGSRQNRDNAESSSETDKSPSLLIPEADEIASAKLAANKKMYHIDREGSHGRPQVAATKPLATTREFGEQNEKPGDCPDHPAELSPSKVTNMRAFFENMAGNSPTKGQLSLGRSSLGSTSLSSLKAESGTASPGTSTKRPLHGGHVGASKQEPSAPTGLFAQASKQIRGRQESSHENNQQEGKPASITNRDSQKRDQSNLKRRWPPGRRGSPSIDQLRPERRRTSTFSLFKRSAQRSSEEDEKPKPGIHVIDGKKPRPEPRLGNEALDEIKPKTTSAMKSRDEIMDSRSDIGYPSNVEDSSVEKLKKSKITSLAHFKQQAEAAKVEQAVDLLAENVSEDDRAGNMFISRSEAREHEDYPSLGDQSDSDIEPTEDDALGKSRGASDRYSSFAPLRFSQQLAPARSGVQQRVPVVVSRQAESPILYMDQSTDESTKLFSWRGQPVFSRDEATSAFSPTSGGLDGESSASQAVTEITAHTHRNMSRAASNLSKSRVSDSSLAGRKGNSGLVSSSIAARRRALPTTSFRSKRTLIRTEINT